jgi:hypothetical protein
VTVDELKGFRDALLELCIRQLQDQGVRSIDRFVQNIRQPALISEMPYFSGDQNII